MVGVAPMKITNFTDYALRTLMYLNVHRDRLCTVREIADFYQVSQNHIVKVVHRLAIEKYIESRKGKGGGIKLKKQAEEINLGRLLVELEPDLNLVECFDQTKNTCNITRGCGLKGILRESFQSFLGTLSKYSLADTIKYKSTFLDRKVGS